MQYFVTGTSEFYYTATGKVGIGLLIGGMIVGGGMGFWWMAELAKVGAGSFGPPPPVIFPVATLTGGIAATCGLFMVFVGRALRHDINVRLYEPDGRRRA